MKSKECSKTKKTGQVFTPPYLVHEMLNYVGYDGINVLGKHLIDNSCGNGAFLMVVVERYCKASIVAGKGITDIKKELEAYIHGIDNDKNVIEQCNINLSIIAMQYGVQDVQWDLHNVSALGIKTFDGKIDYVIGNPPYVRVHNLDTL